MTKQNSGKGNTEGSSSTSYIFKHSCALKQFWM